MEPNNKSWEVVILDDPRKDLLQKAVDFLNTFLPEGMDSVWSVEHFQWKLQNNPAGQGFLSCAIADGNVVGTASITLKRIWYKNQMIIAGETGDTFTHPEYRKKQRTKAAPYKKPTPVNKNAEYLKKSIFGRLVHENTTRALKRGINIIYGTPNEASRRGYEKRLNYKSHSMWEMNLHRPTAQGIVSGKKLAFLFKVLPNKPLSIMMSKIEQGIEFINYKFWEHKRKKLGYAIEITDQATADFNQLWERLKYQNEFSLVRDQIYFQHRFFKNPLAEYEVYKVKHQGEICGVIVIRIRSQAKGEKNCFIADWFFDESKKYLFPVMLAHVIHDQYSKKVNAFRAWSGENRIHTSVIRKLGFVPISKLPIIFFQGNEGKDLLETCLSLDFTIASSDNI